MRRSLRSSNTNERKRGHDVPDAPWPSHPPSLTHPQRADRPLQNSRAPTRDRRKPAPQPQQRQQGLKTRQTAGKTFRDPCPCTPARRPGRWTAIPPHAKARPTQPAQHPTDRHRPGSSTTPPAPQTMLILHTTPPHPSRAPELACQGGIAVARDRQPTSKPRCRLGCCCQHTSRMAPLH
jgi:hypothetical protein